MDWEDFLWHRRELLLDPLGAPRAPLTSASVHLALDALRTAARGPESSGLGAPVDAVRSAALRALARASDEPADVALLLTTLRPGGPRLVAPDAVLALGLLRRSDPAQRMSAELLASVREFLVARLEQESAPPEERLYVALSLGLLADQGGTVDVAESVLASLSKAARHRNDDLARAALVAIGMHVPVRGSSQVEKVLRSLAFNGKGGARAAQAFVALTSWSDEGADSTYVDLLKPGRADRRAQRALALGLGLPAPHLRARGLDRRIHALAEIVKDTHVMGQDELVGYYASVGTYRQALLRDVSLDSRDLGTYWASPPAGNSNQLMGSFYLGALWLRRQDALPTPVGRPRSEGLRAAIRGVSLRDPGPHLGYTADQATLAKAMCADAEERAEIRRLMSTRVPPAGVGGLALGLAIAHDAGELDRKHVLWAASADLDAGPERFDGRYSTRVLSLVGLGLARIPHLDGTLVRRLASAGPEPLRSEIAVALGRTATDETLQQIVDLCRDPQQSARVRLLSCAILGLRLDPERVSSLSLLLERIDYMDDTPWVRDLYRML